jgi:flagellar protein FlaG
MVNMTPEISRSISAPLNKVASNSLGPTLGSAMRPNVSTDSAPVVQPPTRPQIKYDANEMREDLQKAIELLNTQVSKNNLGLGFSMDEALGRPVVTVKNTQSGEVIRQIPNEVVVKIAHNIEAFKGLLHSGMA